MLNLIYVVSQVNGPNSLTPLGYRQIFTNPEDAVLDRYEADKMTKDENGWSHWKIFVYEVKFKGIMD